MFVVVLIKSNPSLLKMAQFLVCNYGVALLFLLRKYISRLNLFRGDVGFSNGVSTYIQNIEICTITLIFIWLCLASFHQFYTTYYSSNPLPTWWPPRCCHCNTSPPPPPGSGGQRKQIYSLFQGGWLSILGIGQPKEPLDH